MSSILPDLSGIRLRDLKDLEVALGRPIGTVFASLSEGDMSNLDAEVLAGFVWLRMRVDDPEITIDAVWDMDLSAFGQFGGESPLASNDSRGPIRSTG